MENMKVCLLNDSFPPVIDGVANTVVNYATILKKEGLADPFVVTPSFPNSDDSGFDFPVLRYKSLNIGNLVGGYRAGMPFSGTLLTDIIAQKPDIIHTHCPVISTVIARELRSKTDAPIIFTYHTKFDVDIAKAVRSKHIQSDVAKFLVRNISACDEVWVVSEGAGENLKSLGYQGDVLVMNNGVDFPKGKADDALVEQVAAEYGLDVDVPILMFVGRLFWYKGIRIIVDALKELAKTQDFRMVFVGKGADEAEIKAYVSECGLDNKCIFTGPIYDREKLRAVNTRGDLFLFPSTYDTNGLVVREAAACGLASMVIKGSCAAEGITDGRNGFFCEENAQSMYQKLSEVLSDMEMVRKVGDMAMEEIYMSWGDSVKAAHERYQIVADRKKCGLAHPEYEGMSDEVYRVSTETLLALKQIRIRSLEDYLEMKQDMTAAYDRMDARFQNMQRDMTAAHDRLDEKFQSMHRDMTDTYDKLDEKFQNMQLRLKKHIREIEEDFDFSDMMSQDRYL